MERASDNQLFQRWLARILRVGVSVAAAIVFVGGVLYLARRPHSLAEYGVFVGEPAEFRAVHSIVLHAAAGSGQGLIQLGLLVLIATPIARVVFSVLAFARERDVTYVFITLVVLLLLIGSLFAG